MSAERPLDIEPILAQVQAGDPVGAAYRLSQLAGREGEGRIFYEAGSIALARREELGEDALRFARIVFGEAVERDPTSVEARHDLATTMRELGMADDAIAEYRRALELRPDDVDSLIGLGGALADAGRLDEAIDVLRRATEAHPDNGRAYANLGVALEVAGRDEEALGAYAAAMTRFDAALLEAEDDERAAEAAAQRRWALLQHASLLERLERWPQAIVQFRRLYEEEQAIEEAEADEAEEGEDESENAGPDDDFLDGAATEGTDPGFGRDPTDDRDHDENERADARHGDDEGDRDDEDAARALDAMGHHHRHAAVEAESEDDEVHAGRLGLERIFSRLVQLGRLDLALLVLDDLGGELADRRTRATYTVYAGEDGVPVIMAESWDEGTRERLDPSKPTSRRRRS